LRKLAEKRKREEFPLIKNIRVLHLFGVKNPESENTEMIIL